jgi:hypothetical protein
LSINNVLTSSHLVSAFVFNPLYQVKAGPFMYKWKAASLRLSIQFMKSNIRGPGAHCK